MELSEKDQARFWSKVALPDGNGCMLWLAGDGHGYGAFSLGRKMTRAHRISYALAYGPIPVGLEIDHVRARGCDSTMCVAPLHLEAVTHAENMRRGRGGERQLARTHCPHGHPYAGENLRIYAGRRFCRTCSLPHGKPATG